jgi:AraC-like DNA-binding protein
MRHAVPELLRKPIVAGATQHRTRGLAGREGEASDALPANQLIHHLATALLEAGHRKGISGLPTSEIPGASGKRWTGNDLARFMRIIGTELNDAFFGLAKSSCPAKSSSFGIELMMLSDTLDEALDRYFRFYEVITDGLRLSLSVDGKSAAIHIVAADPALDPCHFLTEWYAVRLRELAQWLIGEEIPLTGVDFAHTRQLTAPVYADVFGAPVAFNQPVSRFTFPSRYLNRRVVRDLRELSVLSEGEYHPERPPPLHRTWRSMVQSALRGRLYRLAPMPTMEELAGDFAVSSQTLRRGLRTEGTSYRQIKWEARREVVLNNISDTNLTLSQISLLAGFAETNGLARALKSSSGLSPSAFRRVALDGSRTNEPPTSDNAPEDTDH